MPALAEVGGMEAAHKILKWNWWVFKSDAVSSVGGATMFRKMLIAAVMVATFAVAGFVATERSDAHVFARRPLVGTYFYYNGPPAAFVGRPVRVYSSAWDIGPYGPGYGWVYKRPLGVRVDIGH